MNYIIKYARIKILYWMEIKMDKLLDRFLRYVKKETRSDAKSKTVPSTTNQTLFLKDLEKELIELGFSDIKLNSENSFLTATIPATSKKKIPTVGFIAHIDTADFEAENIKPKIHEKYDGKDIILNEKGNIILSPEEFPNLKNYIGKTLITTDGNTLLGADDKAGVAEIVTAGVYLLKNPNIEHGRIRIAFGPDEEIGRGADLFDVNEFDCDFAYTVDGGPLGELEYESFNAARAEVKIQGKNVHPGSAKDTMVNSMSLAIEFDRSLPKYSRPEYTDNRQGFFHLCSINGEVEFTTLEYIIRDHDMKLFEAKKAYINNLAKNMNKSLDKDRISIKIEDEYYNMGDIIKKDFRCIDVAKKAMENLDIEAVIKPIRGGTDGSKISFMGLPTPNLFAGGENFHGRYEFCCLESMEKARDLIIEISKIVTTL